MPCRCRRSQKSTRRVVPGNNEPDRKREIARCLAPALVGGEIPGSAGGADKHRCLAEPGERSEGDHHAEAGRRRRGDRGEAGDDRAADDEPLTAVSVSSGPMTGRMHAAASPTN